MTITKKGQYCRKINKLNYINSKFKFSGAETCF